MEIKKEIRDYYDSGVEADRLNTDVFQLERVRTQEIISCYLSKTPSRILDVGGGTGFYSFWLASKKHEVHLVDPAASNIEKAKKYQYQIKTKLASIAVGEARSLDLESDSFDLVLFFGPLYHLTQRAERLRALREARRVLKPNGIILCAVISRYASMIDGFFKNMIVNSEFIKIMNRDLKSGQHRNTTGDPAHFTTAYFHHPQELKEEIGDAGFKLIKVIPIESFGCLLPDFSEKWKNADFQKLLLRTIRQVEDDPSTAAMTAHLMGIARKK